MPRDRKARIQRLRAALERRGAPRVEMATIVVLTGAAGFLVSAGLLGLGFERMWLRYLLSFLSAYLVFFGLVRLWLHLHGRRLESGDLPDLTATDFDLQAAGVSGPGEEAGTDPGGGQFGGGGASARLVGGEGASSAPPATSSRASAGLDSVDADEWTLPLAIVAALVAALLASAWVVYGAPALLAELLLDGVVAGGLYRRLHRQAPSSWFSIALRSTALPFAATALVFVLAGWFLQSRLPEARSMGDVVRLLQGELPGPRPESGPGEAE